MNILDIVIVVFVLAGLVVGFKRGFTRELVEALGFIGVIVFAYLLKNPVSTILYENLPFINIGILKRVEMLNILVYELIAFMAVAAILGIILKVTVMATTLFEKALEATIILSIPSKFAGAIVGVLYHFVFAFVVLYVLSLTCFNIEFINQSKLKDKIINNTPILSGLVGRSLNVINEFIELKEYSENNEVTKGEFQYKAMELFLKYDVITTESAQKLIDQGKITEFDSYKDLLNKYKEA